MTPMPHSSKAPRASTVTVPDSARGLPLLDFLAGHFPRIDRAIWANRLHEGKILDDHGTPLNADSTVEARQHIRYSREVAVEPVIPFEEHILHEDDRLLVVDKPHFLPVTPSGPWVNECLLYRLMRRTGNQALIPLHRLDRETAGLVLFSKDPATRTAYATLFMRGKVRKRYEAIAPVPRDGLVEWRVENRIEKGEPWFRMKETEGTVNARTVIRLMETDKEWGRFEIEPFTGKQHQIRLHMAHIGAPIRNDWLYPDLQPEPKPGTDSPLQLLARGLSFADPVTGEERHFTSRFQLPSGPSLI